MNQATNIRPPLSIPAHFLPKMMMSRDRPQGAKGTAVTADLRGIRFSEEPEKWQTLKPFFLRPS